MDRLLGHDEAIAALERALASGRFHHAWVFSGPKGVGKRTAAVELARILLDPMAGPGMDGHWRADEHGEVWGLVDAGSHPDLHHVRKELALFSDDAQMRSRKLMNIPLDILREHVIGGRTSDGRVCDGPAYRTAAMGHGKVFIIDEAELVDEAGQNSLLKTLEEPPAHTFLFLITNRPERLLPTIHSRSQHVRFHPLDAGAMQTWLERHGHELDDRRRAWILAFADGAPGIADLAIEYDLYAWHERLAPMIEELAAGGYPPSMGAAMGELVDAFATQWVKTNKNASKDAANKDAVGHLLGLLAFTARRQLAAGDESALIAIDALRDAEDSLRSNVNLKQVLENLVAQWAAVPSAR